MKTFLELLATLVLVAFCGGGIMLIMGESWWLKAIGILLNIFVLGVVAVIVWRSK